MTEVTKQHFLFSRSKNAIPLSLLPFYLSQAASFTFAAETNSTRRKE